MAAAKTKKKQAKVLSSKVAFRGPVFEVTLDEVIEPSGVHARRDTVRHQGSVVILAVDDTREEPYILLEQQYRYPVGDQIWELPAGRIDAGESELAAAKRELLEETGYTARRWKRALFFYASPGFLNETMSIYLARGLKPGKAQPEEDEVIATRFFPLSEVVRLALSGKLRDGKTIAGALWLDRMNGNAAGVESASPRRKR